MIDFLKIFKVEEQKGNEGIIVVFLYGAFHNVVLDYKHL